MATRFDHQAIEKKWQKKWDEAKLYDIPERIATKEKRFILTEFPYPSGNLHIGHWYAFAVPDIYVRKLRMEGKQVLYPIGFDSFGLPAENAAIKRKLDPKEWTYDNIAHMTKQLRQMGNSFDWSRHIITSNPEYYRFTQWIFTECFKNDLAYRGVGAVNWCPNDNTVLANEQVIDGVCERCGATVMLREMPEWKLRITKYADRLIDNLALLPWPEFIKDLQRNWIGRSEGAEIDFTLSTGDMLTVFTTRADTLFGATFLVLAPEHSLLEKLRISTTNWNEVEAYRKATAEKDDIERTNDTKEKTGVRLLGITATNPATGEEIPVFIADYILARYGTGAIMAVPAHDERDGAFAKKYNLSIKHVLIRHYDQHVKEGVETLERGDVVDLIIEHPTNDMILLQREKAATHDHVHFVGGGTDGEPHEVAIARELREETGFTDYTVVSGPLDVSTCLGYRHTKDKNQHTKSHFYHVKLNSLKQVPSEIDDGLHTIEWAHRDDVEKLVNWEAHHDAWLIAIGKKFFTGCGKLRESGEFDGMETEKAKDAIIAKFGGRKKSTYRLRDWSVGRQRYWGVPIPIVYDPEGNAHIVPEEHLPWLLPNDVDVTPTGEPPLRKSQELKERTERIFGKGWTPEVETMDTFMCSSWYYLRYADPTNEKMFASTDAQKEWLPVDIYFGGSEHTTMHLLYSRFMQKVLFDLGHTPCDEPYRVRINRGLVLGPDGNKMSKSKGNVVDPDAQVSLLGADTVKMYLAFMGPYGTPANYPWDMGGIAGIRRFLERVFDLSTHIRREENREISKLLHRTIRKVGDDILNLKFNTAISALMVFVNAVEKEGITRVEYTLFLTLLAPFAPHLTEELWEREGNMTSIHLETWPTPDPALLEESSKTIAVQINGKVRETISLSKTATEEEARATAEAHLGIQKYLVGATLVKVVYVPGRVLNLILAPQGGKGR
jgi:leucyl-tRNA synthetase